MKPFYYSNTKNRLGDEIQMTAVLKYYKQKYPERKILYHHLNRFFDSPKHFPEGLVEFVSETPKEEFEILREHNLWIWSPFLRSQGIYTELKTKHSDITQDIDVAFFPLWSPDYNPQRAMSPRWCAELTRLLLSQGLSVRMVYDAAKQDLFPPSVFPTEVLVPSSSFEESFSWVNRSRVFIGGDTGISHYAGAIKHPKMLLAYGDLVRGKTDFNWQRLDMGKELKEPLLISNPEFNFDSRPDCPPGNFKTYWLFSNRYPSTTIVTKVLELLNKEPIQG